MTYTITNVSSGKTYDILGDSLEILNRGIWYMEDLKIDTQDQFSDQDQVQILFMDKTLTGTITDIVNYTGFISGSVIGGKNTLSNELESISFQGVSVNTIVSYIAAQTGHIVSTSSDQSLLTTSISRFEKLKAMASDSLDKLMSMVGGIWKIALDGSIYVGYESFPDISIKYPSLKEMDNYDVLNKVPNLGFWQVYCEEILIEPGFTVDGNSVRVVHYSLNTESKLNILITWSFPEPEHIAQYKLSEQTRELLYLTRYRMRVISQSSINGNITCFPDPDISILKNGLRDVPIMYTSPDMAITVKPGAICFVEFANGDPGRPYISGWENKPNLTEIDLAASTGPRSVARVNDTVNVGTITISAAPMTGVITGTYQPPIGSPVPIVAGVIPLTAGRISSGSSIVKAGD